VEFDFLSDELDMERMTAGVRHLRQIIDHPAVTSIGNFAGMSGRGTFAVLDNQTTLRDWLRASVEDYVHACGTCRMGSENDPMAVVDASCRYIGIAGLHVVDASVIPSIPRANTHLTTVMIAEKIATTMTAPSS
jgi:choline dehydrogenase-like flavoprotein